MRKSPHTLLSYERVLPALGASVPPPCLPCVSNCPVCSGQLNILQDTTFGGQWYSCQSCALKGNVVELAKQYYQSPAGSALTHLAADMGMLLDQEILDRLLEEERAIVRASSVWEAARVTLSKEAGSLYLPGLLHRYQYFQNPMDWLNRGGQFLGLATRTQIESVTGTLRGLPRKERKEREECEECEECESLVVSPLYDLPDRIAGFWVTTLSGQSIQKTHPQADHVGVVGGWAGGYKYEQTVALDIYQAISLQALNTVDRSRPLPLLGIAKTRPTPSFVSRAAKLLIYVSVPDGDIIRHARTLGARITIATDNLKSIRAALYLRGIEGWLEFVERHSSTWEEALETHLRVLSPDVAENLLLASGMTMGDITRYLDGCDRQTRTRLACLGKGHCTLRKSIHIDNQMVIETEDGWYHGGYSITQAPIVVDDLVTFTKREPLYRGRVIHKGHEYPFQVAQKTFDKDAFLFAKERLLKEGQLLFYESRWAKRAAQIALRLHPPKVIQGVERTGWAGDRFVFPTFTLLRCGQIVPPVEGIIDPASLPGADYDPLGLVPDRLRVLDTSQPLSQFVWTAIAQVASWLLAGPLGESVLPLYITQSESGAVSKILSLLGTGAGGELGVLPCPIEVGDDLRGLIRGVQGWAISRINTGGGKLSLEELERAVRRILPAYLQDVCRRGLSLKGDSGWCLTDLDRWAQRLGVSGVKESVSQGLTAGGGSSPATKYLVELWRKLLDEGVLSTGVWQHRQKSRPGLYTHGGTIIIPWESFTQALVKRGLPGLELDQVRTIVSEAGGQVAAGRERGVRDSLVLCPRWWHEQVAADREQQGLRVYRAV